MGPYRVVQWSTGNVGRRSLRALIDHPELELVGVYVHGADKVGQDAGAMADRPPTGVYATDDVEAIIALAPDCVVYTPSQMDVGLVERLLLSGINVVTTCDFLTGTVRTAERATFSAAALSGGVTFMGTGFEPGFVNLAAGFLTGACRSVRSVRLVETLDCTTYAVAEAWTAMGFGQPLDAKVVPIEPHPADRGLAYFETLDLIASMLAIELDSRDGVIERAAATQDLDLGWMKLPRGSVAGQRRTYRGFVKGRVVVELAICWTMSDKDLNPQWDDPEGFRIEIEGEPRVEATMRYALPECAELSDETNVMSLLMVGTAMSAVHAVPFVCAAQPGVTTPAQLPVFGARHSVI
ncbi:dihydrodipicolinate reductase [Mycobacteriaceae bacterium 1482268.1]|nr:dihydrodipicolinate reductase [Mycobacteriaceae bacterium 1482268.1]